MIKRLLLGLIALIVIAVVGLFALVGTGAVLYLLARAKW